MLELIREKIKSWSRLGVKESPDGSCLFAHIPRDFPEAYLHSIYAPRSKDDWKNYGMNLPKSLEDFFAECNGLSMFNALSIYGIRSHFRRDQSARFQPFDLKSHDKECRTAWHLFQDAAVDTRVFFGGYKWDGSGVYMTGDSPKVYRCLRKSSVPSDEWPDIKSFLESEYERINKFFSQDGYLVVKKLPTVPS